MAAVETNTIRVRRSTRRVSFAMPEMARPVSTARLLGRLGYASADTVEAVAKRVGILIGLGRTR